MPLSRAAHGRDDQNAQLAAAAKEAAKRDVSKPVTPAPGSQNAARAEIAKLLHPKCPLLRGGPEQATAKARYFELLKQIS